MIADDAVENVWHLPLFTNFPFESKKIKWACIRNSVYSLKQFHPKTRYLSDEFKAQPGTEV